MKALFISRDLLKEIKDKRIIFPKVHSVFNNACNLEYDEKLITILTKEKVATPMSIVVENIKGFSFKDLGLKSDDKFIITNEKCYLGKIRIYLSGVPVFNPYIEKISTLVDNNTFAKNLKVLELALSDYGKLKFFYPFIEDIRMFINDFFQLGLRLEHNSTMGDMDDNNYLFIKERFVEFLKGVICYDIRNINIYARKIIGFGQGLTPSIDDFISGIMIALIYLSDYYNLDVSRIYEFNNKLIADSLNGTTKVSQEMLKHSAKGIVNEGVKKLMTTLLSSDDSVEISNALRKVISFGETSGSDTAFGIYLGFRIITDISYRRNWKMKLCVEIRKNVYYDSVALMIITKEVKKMDFVKEVIVGMATDLNKELADNLNLSTDEIKSLTPNDFFIAAYSDDEDGLEKIVNKVNELLNSKQEEKESEVEVKTLTAAVNHMEDANMAVISLPGKHAAYEVKKALNKGLNVMLFSDNVTVEEEVELKTLGRDKGLLVMGPDCGTAIINGVPLCFANVVRRGNIGVVGASGTGTQEVTVIIDKLGGGLSQVIGTGGRDLKSEVGGIMMIEGFKALIDDPSTDVIVLISKPPAKEVAEKILEMVKTTEKPVVVDFIGGDRDQIERSGAYPCISLEDAAYKAYALTQDIKPVDYEGFEMDEAVVDEIVKNEVNKLNPDQKYLRALYTGGTLADEAMKLLGKDGFSIYSNIPLSPEFRLKEIGKSEGHTCIDLGDDDFTVGRPHPMIDPIGRVERLPQEAEDDDVAVILMDFVIGYGSNVDPAGEMLPYIIDAKKKMEDKGKYLSVIGYICGTDKDPQSYREQKEKLEAAGVILMPTNAQAVRLTAKLLKAINK